MFKKLLIWLGVIPDPDNWEEQILTKLLDKTKQWKSLKVSRRGGIRIDPQEVFNSPEFQESLKKASRIVLNQRCKCK